MGGRTPRWFAVPVLKVSVLSGGVSGLPDLLCVPSCPLWLSSCFSQSRAMSAMTRDSGDSISRARKIAAPQPVIVSERRSRESNDLSRRSPLCVPLPASLSHRPTPIAPLLKAKAEPQFEKTVESLSAPLFPVFRRFNRGQFHGPFCGFTVRSAEGRNA